MQQSKKKDGNATWILKKAVKTFLDQVNSLFEPIYQIKEFAENKHK